MPFAIQTPSQLAFHLKALRLANGLTQAELARKLDLSQTRIARIENDPLSISVGQFLKVLTALNSTMSLQTDLKPNTTLSAAAKVSTKASASLETGTRKSNAGDW